jgi:hypothetical protein
LGRHRPTRATVRDGVQLLVGTTPGPEKGPSDVALGPRAGLAGGKARAPSITPELASVAALTEAVKAQDGEVRSFAVGWIGFESDRVGSVSAFIITRIRVGDYDSWRVMFDQDRPRAREHATTVRVLRDVDDPGQVFIFLEFACVEDAKEARTRLTASGVLDRFEDKHGPTVLEAV